jgi:hypothetical protein
MSTGKFALLFAGAGLALGLAACGTHSNSGAAAGATGAPTATSSVPATSSAPATNSAPATSSAPTTSSRPATSSAPATRPVPGKATTASACPVTEAELQATVKRKTDNGVSSKSRFTKIVCYKGYAAATVPENSRSDEQYAVFKHVSAGWRPMTVASADICRHVPADVVKHFRSAHYGACD